jgi:uncharacterized caspase-like protein
MFCLDELQNSPTKQRRIALVIGNGAYGGTLALANPVNDARAVRAELSRLRFDLHGGYDLSAAGMNAELDGFFAAIEAAKVRGEPYEVGLVYYAGHGLQINGVNYAVPCDVTLRFADEYPKLISMQRVNSELGEATPITLFFIDACRDDGGAGSPSGLLAASVAARSMAGAVPGAVGAPGQKGLAIPTLGSNSFIAFATDPNDYADDCAIIDGKRTEHSPFSEAVCRYLATPGLEIYELSQRVAKRVRQTTTGLGDDRPQRPWAHGNLTAPFYLWAPPTGADRDRRPIRFLTRAGALAGLSVAALRISGGEWNLHTNVSMISELLLNGLVFGLALAIAAHLWGRATKLEALIPLVIFMLACMAGTYFVNQGVEVFRAVTCVKDGGDKCIDMGLSWEQLKQTQTQALILMISVGGMIVGLGAALGSAAVTPAIRRTNPIVLCGFVGIIFPLVLFTAFKLAEHYLKDWWPSFFGERYLLKTIAIFILSAVWHYLFGLIIGRHYSNYVPRDDK